MATIKDIAKLAGVSVGTASRAITGNGYVAEDKKRLVMEAAQKLGYTPKVHEHKDKKVKAVAIALPDTSLPFYGNFLKYAEVELDRLGYKTVVCNVLGVQNRVNRILDQLEDGSLDGLILDADVTGEEICRMEKLPVVCFERMISEKIPMVSSDHQKGGKLAAQELIAAGCKNVMIATVAHLNPLYGDIRNEECRRILEEHGVNVTVVETSRNMISLLSFKELAREYLRLYRNIDGIFSDDLQGYCFMLAAMENHIRIPEDLKIVGYDGNEIIHIMSPSITTIQQDLSEITHQCIDLLMKRMENGREAGRRYAPVYFLKGGTT